MHCKKANFLFFFFVLSWYFSFFFLFFSASSTLFGVCVLQIKPQLEKLLNLPNDALTKEIALTQVQYPFSPLLWGDICLYCLSLPNDALTKEIALTQVCNATYEHWSDACVFTDMFTRKQLSRMNFIFKHSHCFFVSYQDLLKLFIEYQIPSDLISYDGDKDAPTSAKVKNKQKKETTNIIKTKQTNHNWLERGNRD